MKKESLRTDPFTKENFVPKRSNQIFKSRANQIKYNNEKAKSERLKLATPQKSLKKNYRILSKILIGKKPPVITMDYLEGAGFDFNYFTGIHTHAPKLSARIFDLTITQVSESQYKIEQLKQL